MQLPPGSSLAPARSEREMRDKEGGCGSRRVSRNRENPRSRLRGSRIQDQRSRTRRYRVADINPRRRRRGAAISTQSQPGKGRGRGMLRASSVHLQSRTRGQTSTHACMHARGGAYNPATRLSARWIRSLLSIHAGACSEGVEEGGEVWVTRRIQIGSYRAGN